MLIENVLLKIFFDSMSVQVMSAYKAKVKPQLKGSGFLGRRKYVKIIASAYIFIIYIKLNELCPHKSEKLFKSLLELVKKENLNYIFDFIPTFKSEYQSSDVPLLTLARNASEFLFGKYSNELVRGTLFFNTQFKLFEEIWSNHRIEEKLKKA